MSTYDGAYSNKNPDDGYDLCCCYDDRINVFCKYHGTRKNELVNKLNLGVDLNGDKTVNRQEGML